MWSSFVFSCALNYSSTNNVTDIHQPSLYLSHPQFFNDCVPFSAFLTSSTSCKIPLSSILHSHYDLPASPTLALLWFFLLGRLPSARTDTNALSPIHLFSTFALPLIPVIKSVRSWKEKRTHLERAPMEQRAALKREGGRRGPTGMRNARLGFTDSVIHQVENSKTRERGKKGKRGSWRNGKVGEGTTRSPASVPPNAEGPSCCL